VIPPTDTNPEYQVWIDPDNFEPKTGICISAAERRLEAINSAILLTNKITKKLEDIRHKTQPESYNV
jgi:hypothetical protein